MSRASGAVNRDGIPREDHQVTGKAVRLDDDGSVLVVGDRPHEIVVHNTGADEFFAHLEDIRDAGATELRNALKKAPGIALLINTGDRATFDYEYSVASPVSLVLDDNDLIVEVLAEMDDYFEEAEATAIAATTLRPLLDRSRAVLRRASPHRQSAASPWLYTIQVKAPTRGRTVGQLYELGTDVEALLTAATTGTLSRETVLDLIRGGRAELLVGASEGQWLDAKKQDYDLDNDRGKISLAQDVARFANGEEGGLIVVGMATKKSRGTETISATCPVPPPSHGVRRHSQTIDARVFPPVDGLTVEEVRHHSGVLILVHVPPQPEELKPFLVHGAIVGERFEGAFISIVRRRGEESVPITAQAIHSTLAAGRALLRRGDINPQ